LFIDFEKAFDSTKGHLLLWNLETFWILQTNRQKKTGETTSLLEWVNKWPGSSIWTFNVDIRCIFRR